MQHSVEVTMEQHVYHLFMHWLVEVPRLSRFHHLPRWTVGNCAYEFLAVSTAAASPSRRAAVDVAQRLFMVQLRADQRESANDAATVERRIHRAVMLTGLPVNPRDHVETWVRMVANEYRLERSISAWALGSNDRPFTRAGARRLYMIMRETVRPDVDSNSDMSDAEG